MYTSQSMTSVKKVIAKSANASDSCLLRTKLPFSRMSHRDKRLYRNKHCPKLMPLSTETKRFITDLIRNTNPEVICDELGQENDEGQIEFKWKLVHPPPDRLQHLMTQMTYRLEEGNGQCFYELGVHDNGHPQGLSDEELIATVETIFLMAHQLSAQVSVTKIRQGEEGKVASIAVKSPMQGTPSKVLDVRLCVAGNESVGKSTLIGVLTRGKLDDGRGAARMNVFQHPHELFDGRTSSISYHILGFDEKGSVTNYDAFHQGEWSEIVRKSSKLITFVDLAGSHRYHKTAVTGLSSHSPDHVMLVISPNDFDQLNLLARRRAAATSHAKNKGGDSGKKKGKSSLGGGLFFSFNNGDDSDSSSDDSDDSDSDSEYGDDELENTPNQVSNPISQPSEPKTTQEYLHKPANLDITATKPSIDGSVGNIKNLALLGISNGRIPSSSASRTVSGSKSTELLTSYSTSNGKTLSHSKPSKSSSNSMDARKEALTLGDKLKPYISATSIGSEVPSIPDLATVTGNPPTNGLIGGTGPVINAGASLPLGLSGTPDMRGLATLDEMPGMMERMSSLSSQMSPHGTPLAYAGHQPSPAYPTPDALSPSTHKIDDTPSESDHKSAVSPNNRKSCDSCGSICKCDAVYSMSCSELSRHASLSPRSGYSSAFSLNMKHAEPSYHRYFAMCQSLGTPLFIVLTKADCQRYKHRIPDLISRLETIIAKETNNKMRTKVIHSASEASRAARAMSAAEYVPIFVASAVTGEGLAPLKTFLYSLSHRRNWNAAIHNPPEFGVDNIYEVNGVGIIVGGVVREGQIVVNQKLLLGPSVDDGSFREVTIKSVHVRRRHSPIAYAGQMASFHIAELTNRDQIRRGMVLLDGRRGHKRPQACWSFEAEIDVLYGCKIKKGSQPVVHVDSIRQAAHIISLTPVSVLNGGDNGLAQFAFCHRSEYVRIGQRVLIRKSMGTIAVGRVARILDTADAPLVPNGLLTASRNHRRAHHLLRSESGGTRVSRSRTVESSSSSNFSTSEEDDDTQPKNKTTDQSSVIPTIDIKTKPVSNDTTAQPIFATDNVPIATEKPIATVIPMINRSKDVHSQPSPQKQCWNIPKRNASPLMSDDPNLSQNGKIVKMPREKRIHSIQQRQPQSQPISPNIVSRKKRKKARYVLVWRLGIGYANKF